MHINTKNKRFKRKILVIKLLNCTLYYTSSKNSQTTLKTAAKTDDDGFPVAPWLIETFFPSVVTHVNSHRTDVASPEFLYKYNCLFVYTLYVFKGSAICYENRILSAVRTNAVVLSSKRCLSAYCQTTYQTVIYSYYIPLVIYLGGPLHTTNKKLYNC